MRGGVEGVGDTELELALLGAEHDGLAVHAAHHVEGCLRFAAQRQFEEVVSNALLDGFAQLMLDLEEAVGGAEAADALVGPLVVVVFDPELDALAGNLEALELGANQEVLPDRGPEALDLAQRHGVLGPGLEVRDAILLELGREAAGAAPGSVLAAIVSEHLLGRLELADGDAINLDDRLRRGTAEQVRADDEARIIIQESDEVGVTATQPEREDVRLPHLVGRGPLEETGPGEVALFGRHRRWHQLGLVQALTHGLGAAGDDIAAIVQFAPREARRLAELRKGGFEALAAGFPPGRTPDLTAGRSSAHSLPEPSANTKRPLASLTGLPWASFFGWPV